MKISKETQENINRMKELKEKAIKIREQLGKEAKSFLAINVAESDNEYLFISGLSQGSIASNGDEQHYVDEEFVNIFTDQYKERNSC